MTASETVRALLQQLRGTATAPAARGRSGQRARGRAAQPPSRAAQLTGLLTALLRRGRRR